MIIVGIIIGIGATIIEHTYALADYWRPIYLFPHFPFEDFYYGFVFGGISTAFSEFLFNKRDSKKRTYPAYQKLIILFTLLTTLCFLYFVHFLQLNSIVAHITPPHFTWPNSINNKKGPFLLRLQQWYSNCRTNFNHVLDLEIIISANFSKSLVPRKSFSTFYFDNTN